jgi:hypothetical protein
MEWVELTQLMKLFFVSMIDVIDEVYSCLYLHSS